MHVCEAEIAALETMRDLGVIEAEQVQHRGVQIVDVDFVLGGVDFETRATAPPPSGKTSVPGSSWRNQ